MITLDRTTVRIRATDNGPVGLANGGFACGTFAGLVGGTASVRLRHGVPVGAPLTVRRARSGVEVLHDNTMVATAQPTAAFSLDPPARPSWVEALAARARHPFHGVEHPLSHCVVCGPERTDGLGATPGPLDGHPEILAAPFQPPASYGVGGVVRPEAVWGALDCPSYPAAALANGELCLLGSLEAHLRRPVVVGERLVVVGWTRSHGTRSHHTASVLVDGTGAVVASARATWVALA